MKTMTCRQMGGPCDMPFQGETADEIMKKGADHVTEMVAKGDEGHKAAAAMMAEAQADPAKAQAWSDKFHADYAAQKED